MIIKFLNWLASLVEDKRGAISAKRVGFFWCLFMLQRAIGVKDINEVIIWAIVGLAFGLAGLTIPEWFSNINNKKIKPINPETNDND